MPLAKKMKGDKANQGAQTKPGNAGNIKNSAIKGAQGKRAPRNNNHGRNVSIGRK